MSVGIRAGDDMCVPTLASQAACRAFAFPAAPAPVMSPVAHQLEIERRRLLMARYCAQRDPAAWASAVEQHEGHCRLLASLLIDTDDYLCLF